MLIDGKSQKQIALETGKSLSTIKKDLAAARTRAGADSLHQLVAVSNSCGLVPCGYLAGRSCPAADRFSKNRLMVYRAAGSNSM